jgi:hypothetical protein
MHFKKTLYVFLEEVELGGNTATCSAIVDVDIPI